MHADRGSGGASADAELQPSELDVLRARCWRQAKEISALGDTISVLRRGATALAVQNAELQAVIACLDAPVDLPRSARESRVTRRGRSARSTRCW
jgi:hypothetical protein